MFNHLNFLQMYINGRIRSIGEIRQVQFPDEVKVTRQVVIDFFGALFYDSADQNFHQKEQTIAVDVWGKQASDPKYQVGDIVDVIIEFSITGKEGKVFNNVRARMIIPPLRK